MDNTLQSNTTNITSTNHNQGICSLEICENEVIFAHIIKNNEQAQTLIATGSRTFQDTSVLEFNLNELVMENRLTGLDCNVVLHPKLYRLLLLDKPPVPPNEYREALRWQLHDLIDYPLEDIVLDVFTPAAMSNLETDKLYVVTAQSSVMQQIAKTIQNCQLNLLAIDIREFAIRNLVMAAYPNGDPIAFLQIDENNCLLLIIKQNMLYFARRAPIGFATATSADLTAEIRRSFEYYTTELRQEIPSKLLITPTPTSNVEIYLNIGKNLEKEVHFIDINQIVKGSRLLTIDEQQRYHIAIGEALRK